MYIKKAGRKKTKAKIFNKRKKTHKKRGSSRKKTTRRKIIKKRFSRKRKRGGGDPVRQKAIQLTNHIVQVLKQEIETDSDNTPDIRQFSKRFLDNNKERILAKVEEKLREGESEKNIIDNFLDFNLNSFMIRDFIYNKIKNEKITEEDAGKKLFDINGPISFYFHTDKEKEEADARNEAAQEEFDYNKRISAYGI